MSAPPANAQVTMSLPSSGKASTPASHRWNACSSCSTSSRVWTTWTWMGSSDPRPKARSEPSSGKDGASGSDAGLGIYGRLPVTPDGLDWR
jgi:hypothetical protein